MINKLAKIKERIMCVVFLHFLVVHTECKWGFPSSTSSKEPSWQCRRGKRDAGSISGSGRSPGGGRGNPLQYSFLENPMDRGAWYATVHRVI